MSVESISLVIGHSRSENTARLVLFIIANHDGEGGAWPSIDTIARGTRKSRSAVQRGLRELVELGELVIHRNDGGTHKTRSDRRPNRYEITIDPTAAAPGILPDDAGDDPDDGAAAARIDGVSPVTPRGGGRGTTADTPLDGHGVSPAASRGVTAVTPEPSLTTQVPPTPTAAAAGEPALPTSTTTASRRSSCPAHPAGAPNCRFCGTTPRQLAKAAEKSAETRRRAEEQAAWRREQTEARETRKAAEATAERNTAIARAAIAQARETASTQAATRPTRAVRRASS